VNNLVQVRRTERFVDPQAHKLPYAEPTLGHDYPFLMVAPNHVFTIAATGMRRPYQAAGWVAAACFLASQKSDRHMRA
jgi:hypothetical protein